MSGCVIDTITSQDIAKGDKEHAPQIQIKEEELWKTIAAAYDPRDEAILGYLPFSERVNG